MMFGLIGRMCSTSFFRRRRASGSQLGRTTSADGTNVHDATSTARIPSRTPAMYVPFLVNLVCDHVTASTCAGNSPNVPATHQLLLGSDRPEPGLRRRRARTASPDAHGE